MDERENSSLVLYHCTPTSETDPSPDRIKMVFCSFAHWLHPLFEVEHYLSAADAADRTRYILYDSMVGMASAYMVLHLRIPIVITKMISAPAMELLGMHDVACVAEQTVPAIGCRTELLLREKQIISIEKAYDLLSSLRDSGESKDVRVSEFPPDGDTLH